jgi:hypothetical protein
VVNVEPVQRALMPGATTIRLPPRHRKHANEPKHYQTVNCIVAENTKATPRTGIISYYRRRLTTSRSTSRGRYGAQSVCPT